MKRYSISLLTLIFASVFFVSCGNKNKSLENIVDVTAKDYYFHVNDSIPSGWTKFNFHNEGKAHHFFFLTKLPENVPYERYHKEVMPPFVEVMDSLKSGMSMQDAGALLGSLLPAWYGNAKVMGGAGLIASGKSVQTTINLEPGTYAMECYVKTEEGKFHSELGMIRPFVVTDEVSELEEPDDADIDLTLTNYKIESEGEVTPGKHRVAVHFKEHPEYGLGNDVHVVKLDESTNIDSVAQWMNWMNIGGLRSPSPAEFLGGTQEMPVGYTSYFTVNLEPGIYAWISEGGASQGMYKEFSVK